MANNKHLDYRTEDERMGFSKPLARHRVTLYVDPQTLSTAQQKGEKPYIGRDGKPYVRHFVKTKVERSRNSLERAIRAAFPVVTRPPDAEHPWKVVAIYRYHPKDLKRYMLGQYRTKAPDVDNLAKDLLDCITNTGVAWKDDRQVVIAAIVKQYVRSMDEPAHIELRISQLKKPVKKGK